MTLVSSIPKIIAYSTAKVSLAVRMAERRITLRSKAKSRVRTGNMRGGWQSQEMGAFEGIVFNLVDYTVYNEFGTVYMSAQPMLRPAIEETRSEFELDVRSAYLPA